MNGLYSRLFKDIGFGDSLHSPLDVEDMATRGIARLASGNHIVFSGAAPARERDKVIHGQLVFFKFLTTVMADTGANLLAPPLRCFELAGFGSFPFYMGITFGLIQNHALHYNAKPWY